MSRWHRSSCDQPDIVVVDGSPKCLACESEPDLEKIKLEQPSFPSLDIPPNEPPGQLNLWWPKCVPYTDKVLNFETQTMESDPSVVQTRSRDAVDEPLIRPEPIDADKQDFKNLRKAMDPPDGVFNASEIYTERLHRHQFRLLILPGAENINNPIHVELETWSRERCPQYEATSYLWGGDDNDSRPLKAVYVGPFWDVLLQTKNCYSMLRFLRPTRGIRIVWVDALCINQYDVIERAEQVAIMSQIYTQAQQVIMYLGNESSRNSTGNPPQRMPLISRQKSDTQALSAAREMLQRFFSHRYFSRLWMIPEVIFGRRIICQIDDIEYWIDAHTTFQPKKPRRFGSRSHDGYLTVSDLESISPPRWFENAAGGGSSDVSLSTALDFSARAHCSDPRDSIFAALALSDDHDSDLQPLYTISPRHVGIGIFAYMLFVEEGALALERCKPLSQMWPPWTEVDFTKRAEASRPRDLPSPGPACTILNHGIDFTICNDREWKTNAFINKASGAIVLETIHILKFPRGTVLARSAEDLWVLHNNGVSLSFSSREKHHSLNEIEGLNIFAIEENGSPMSNMRHGRSKNYYFVLANAAAESGHFHFVTVCDSLVVSIDSKDPNVAARELDIEEDQRKLPIEISPLQLGNTVHDMLSILQAPTDSQPCWGGAGPSLSEFRHVLLIPLFLSRETWYFGYDADFEFWEIARLVCGKDALGSRLSQFWAGTPVIQKRKVEIVQISDGHVRIRGSGFFAPSVEAMSNDYPAKSYECWRQCWTNDRSGEWEASCEELLKYARGLLKIYVGRRLRTAAKKTGESLEALLSREPRPRDKLVGVPWAFPDNIVEALGIQGGRYSITLL